MASTVEPYPKGSTGYRISTLFSVVIVFGLAGTSYILYRFYTSVTTFPPELRPDLRAAVKARASDPIASAKFFRRAWEAARKMSPEDRGPLWPKKVSGIAIALGEMLEKCEEPKDALDVLKTAWTDLEPASHTSDEMKQRRIAMASKMSDLADDAGLPAEEEKWAVWAVEEILKEGAVSRPAATGKEVQGEEELTLPSWVGKAEAASCLEKLGAIYAKQGNLEYAVPLYLRALGQLPLKLNASSPDQQATPTSLCRAATLFNNLSNLFSLKAVPGSDQLNQALAWGQRGMQAFSAAEKMGLEQADDPDACRRTSVVSQVNQATLSEMAGNAKAAEQLYLSAGRLAVQMRWGEAAKQAEEGLRRVANKDLRAVLKAELVGKST